MLRKLVIALAVVLTAGRASAQFEFVGSWAPIGTEDVQNDSVPVDYLGLALTEEGRVRALTYDESQKSMVERQCEGWGAAYLVIGPFGLRVSAVRVRRIVGADRHRRRAERLRPRRLPRARAH